MPLDMRSSTALGTEALAAIDAAKAASRLALTSLAGQLVGEDLLHVAAECCAAGIPAGLLDVVDEGIVGSLADSQRPSRSIDSDRIRMSSSSLGTSGLTVAAGGAGSSVTATRVARSVARRNRRRQVRSSHSSVPTENTSERASS